nr:exo-beta-N-acetylmuramidase NamZ domain-containing protein [Hymenobacter sp. BRD67]
MGAAQLSQYLPALQGKRVGLVVNQTSRIGATYLVDTLKALHVNLTAIFAPEHGFREKPPMGPPSPTGAMPARVYRCARCTAKPRSQLPRCWPM